MATELPTAVIARDTSDGQIVEGLAVASSIRQTYRKADLTALQTVTGQLTGDFGYTLDTGYTYQWSGTEWTPVIYDTGKIAMSSVGVWASGWSGPAFGSIEPAYVRLRNGIAFMYGAFAKNTSWAAGEIVFTFTDPRFIPTSTYDTPGKVTPNTFSGLGVRSNGSVTITTANGSSGTFINMSATWLP